MGIKLCKKESMERCDSCGAVMTEYDYDRYGGLCKYCRPKESKQESGGDAITFAEPSFEAATYGLEEISKNDSGEIDVVDGVDSNDSAPALAKKVTALHKKYPEKKYHIIAIGTDADGIEDKSEATALNRITMKDARKALDKLQKDGTLDKALHEITVLHSFVGNYLANTDPDVTDNKLNSPERKIVARAVLAHLAEQFGYQPEDLR